MLSLLIAPLLALALAPAKSDGRTLAVELKDGRSMNAEVLGVKDGKAELRLLVLGGEAIVKRDLSEFAPESAFAIEAHATRPTTFEQRFALAKRAAELDLLTAAGAQARAARAALGADPAAKAKEAELRSWAAGALEAMIGKAVASGDAERANDALDILTTRLADQRDEAQLVALAEKVAALDEQVAVKAQAARAAKLDARKKADLEKRVAPIREKTAQGDKALNEAFARSGNTSASAKSSEKAIDAYKAAWKLAEALAKEHADDEEIQREAVEFGQRLQASGIRAALHAASVLTTQTDYKGATGWVNRVLAFDPDNAGAKEMLASIQQASAAGSNDDWRYGWRGRGRARPR